MTILNMMSTFWTLSMGAADAPAIVTEAGQIVSYAQLSKDIESFSVGLPDKRSLVFLSVDNNYESVIAYLACLSKGHPFLILDIGLEQALKEPLFFQYEPNVHIESGQVHLLHHREYSLHPDLAMMMSTSGTTGSPKLVRLSKKNLSSNAVSIVEYLKIRSSDVAITTLPMSYSYGLSVINSHLAAGACIVLNSDSILTREFWGKVKEHKVVTLSGVPFTYQMLKKLNYKRFDTSPIRYLTQAGGKLDENTLTYFQQVCSELGQDFVVMYGQTEASPRISYVPATELKDKIGSIGVAVPGGTLQIFAHDTLISEVDTEGEIVYSGPNVMMGYAESTADLSLPDTQGGQLRTGDLGYADSDGYFYITGRAKRFIKLFGLRIGLDEIDNWLAKKGIEAVSAGSDDGLVVFYTLKELQIETVKLELGAEFKLNVNFVNFTEIDSIPRTNGGKVDFKKLNQLIN
ncbi:AMP-binding protein [Shewanella xiamenensis]|uniref:AMP-binding protein n=1 Tax=Shewanella xiamenensis TaxID=332186 RepID=UPI0035B8C051